jgi:hypothetical protein
MSETYLIWSSRELETTERMWTADVPDGSGRRKEVPYTVKTDDPAAVTYPDKIIMWEGAEKDVENIRSTVRPFAPRVSQDVGVSGEPTRRAAVAWANRHFTRTGPEISS